MNAANKQKLISYKENPVSTALKLQIKNRINSMNINVRALERKAGLNIGTVNNILHGTSTNPTAETLIALAKAFECTIDDLLNIENNKNMNESANNFESFQSFQWNSSLFLSIVVELNKQIKNKHLYINSGKVLSIINEIYLYSLKKNKDTVEESLVEWLLEKSL
jgi:transcriptional regulator with XRE-family HTH domain